jgi:hydrogenase expression/formation protein HypE
MMNKKNDCVLLAHGNGGRLMHDLISGLFVRHFGNRILRKQNDSAVVRSGSPEMAFTTDSFVVDPVFFPGGDIGKLAVCGTVNDIAMTGAVPEFLSASFILEEGFPLKELEKIVISMAAEAKKAGVSIVTGDTKVVNKGKCDKIFINTSGVGWFSGKRYRIAGTGKIRPGDQILVNGNIGDHGIAVMNARESFHFSIPVRSDCASLNRLTGKILDYSPGVRFMRDPTRGGLATVLNELAEGIPYGIEIYENALPVSKGVSAMCEILGYDPLYIANEGKVLLVAGRREGGKILRIMKGDTLGRNAAAIGTVVNRHPGRVVLITGTGGTRITDMLTGDLLPRIC